MKCIHTPGHAGIHHSTSLEALMEIDHLRGYDAVFGGVHNQTWNLISPEEFSCFKTEIGGSLSRRCRFTRGQNTESRGKLANLTDFIHDSYPDSQPFYLHQEQHHVLETVNLCCCFFEGLPQFYISHPSFLLLISIQATVSYWGSLYCFRNGEVVSLAVESLSKKEINGDDHFKGYDAVLEGG